MPAQTPGNIVGVATSTACFIGKTDRGPVCSPRKCYGYIDYENIFGPASGVGDTALAVNLFFSNGGNECWVVRISENEIPSKVQDYKNAFSVVDSEVDFFNLMILPKDNHIHALPPNIYNGMASVCCRERRALLILDPPAGWTNVQEATDPVNGISSFSDGLVRDFCAVYFPNLVIKNADGSIREIGPSGAIAGMMSRIDASHGVWKAPAGDIADIENASDLKLLINDSDNEILNSAGINAIREFQGRIVCWGARTVDGADSLGSEWKYIPIRRTALFIEQSLNEGLQWVVFEPNNESLWAQIQNSAERFMHQLFNAGAFQGMKPDDAFYVKCDSDTTTQNDIDNGIVNIQIGFAPLQAAEFIIISIQLMTAQCE
jgi:uncharacterized protein